MKEKLSVIVPCYNVEKYIDTVINCLINQTYNPIEIICIDDSSTDDTYNQLKKFENIENIKIYQNETNKGLAYTRNFGVKKATSKYIGFIDADDKIDSDYYEILMNKLISTNSDVVVTDIAVIFENDKEKMLYETGCKEGEKTNRLNFIDRGMAASACNKVFDKELLIKYPFYEGKINEDVATVLPILIKAKKVEYANNTKYYYLQRNNSIQNSKVSKKRLDVFYTVEKCLNCIKDENDYYKYKEKILYNQIGVLYLNVIALEKRFFNRLNLLRIYMKRQKKYEIYKNKEFNYFLEKQGPPYRAYFEKLLILLKKGKFFKACCYISYFEYRHKQK